VVKIKGSVLRSRLAMVDEMAPDGGRGRVLARLEPQDREALGALLASSWYPFELGRHLDAAIVEELGGGQATFFEKVGDKEAVLTTHEAETFSAPDCATVVGWYRRALEMCGVRDPRVVEEECRAKGGAVCRYRITWS
jgi:hypothetical protein